jgi:hypothetical protein
MLTSLPAKLIGAVIFVFLGLALIYLGAIDLFDPRSKAEMLAERAAKLPRFARLFFSPRIYISNLSIVGFRVGGALAMLSGATIIVAIVLAFLHGL